MREGPLSVSMRRTAGLSPGPYGDSAATGLPSRPLRETAGRMRTARPKTPLRSRRAGRTHRRSVGHIPIGRRMRRDRSGRMPAAYTAAGAGIRGARPERPVDRLRVRSFSESRPFADCPFFRMSVVRFTAKRRTGLRRSARRSVRPPLCTTKMPAAGRENTVAGTPGVDFAAARLSEEERRARKTDTEVPMRPRFRLSARAGESAGGRNRV